MARNREARCGEIELHWVAVPREARAQTSPHRHCEAAKPPKQSREAAPRFTGGRRTVWRGCILDCFARASRGLAMTEERPCRESCAGGEGTALSTVIARRRSRRRNPGRPRREFRRGRLLCCRAASGLLRPRFARARNDGGPWSRGLAMTENCGAERLRPSLRPVSQGWGNIAEIGSNALPPTRTGWGCRP